MLLPTTAAASQEPPRRGLSLRLLPLLFLTGLGVVVALGYALRITPEGKEIPIPHSVSQLRDIADGIRLLAEANPALFAAFISLAYLMKQTFAIPGSGLLNALVGVAYGVWAGVPVATLLSALGSLCGYVLSREFGGRAVQHYRLDERLWPLRMQVEAARKRGTLFCTLLSMRIFPGTPHWALNLAAPHVGVGVPAFIASTSLGMLGYNSLCVYAGASVHATSWSEVFSWHAVLAMACLAALCALPALAPRRMEAMQRGACCVRGPPAKRGGDKEAAPLPRRLSLGLGGASVGASASSPSPPQKGHGDGGAPAYPAPSAATAASESCRSSKDSAAYEKGAASDSCRGEAFPVRLGGEAHSGGAAREPVGSGRSRLRADSRLLPAAPSASGGGASGSGMGGGEGEGLRDPVSLKHGAAGAGGAGAQQPAGGASPVTYSWFGSWFHGPRGTSDSRRPAAPPGAARGAGSGGRFDDSEDDGDGVNSDGYDADADAASVTIGSRGEAAAAPVGAWLRRSAAAELEEEDDMALAVPVNTWPLRRHL